MADTPVEFTSHVAESVCKDFAQASRLEWLQTNHTGAFAMGTVAGVNTRRYHGLLIASLNPPADRYSIFSRVEETVQLGDQQFELAAVQYPGTVTPAGYQLLEGFDALPCPTWRYECNGVLIEKTVQLLDGEQSVVLTYSTNAECVMRVRLFVSFRDYHSLMRQNDSLKSRVVESPGCLTLWPYDMLPQLQIYHNAKRFVADGEWFQNHEYLCELDRGLDFREDLYSPGLLEFQLSPEHPVHLTATLETIKPVVKTPAVFPDALTHALDQFRVVRSDKRPTLIAGYPWFTDWSRDTLISLPALIKCGFDPMETRAILEFLLAERKQGILPNRFTDAQSTPEYNTVDASLWFFVAAHHYVSETQDVGFVESTLLPAALDILDWHRRGTFYGIRVDPEDHLLTAGQHGTQLTWMDAKIGDYVVTPRMGKPVEINALWFNALKITSGWAAMVGKPTLDEEAAEVQKSFVAKFWNDARSCLYDVLTPDSPDASVRPNQLFALSLPYPLVDQTKARAIIATTQRLLLTPVGLRTLEPADPRYCPRFAGDMRARDSAYHQGTVWPWLLGPFIVAYLYAHGNTRKAKEECRHFTASIQILMQSYCVGSIAEVYDGDAPHHAGGCPAQLWSVAQLAMALHLANQP